jgi:hypothetical protein
MPNYKITLNQTIMKKFFAPVAFVALLSVTMFSCTEEEVKPTTDTNKAGTMESAKGF